MRILLAEDERELSRVLVAALQLQGYEVDAVEAGEAAVLSAHTHVYDAMILDIMMPKKDGLTALSEIRAAGSVTPVLMLTAKAELSDRVAGLDAGADDYLTKPFAIREMLARLRAITRRSSGYTPSKLSLGRLTLDVEAQELSNVTGLHIALSHVDAVCPHGKCHVHVVVDNEGDAVSAAECLQFPRLLKKVPVVQVFLPQL